MLGGVKKLISSARAKVGWEMAEQKEQVLHCEDINKFPTLKEMKLKCSET